MRQDYDYMQKQIDLSIAMVAENNPSIAAKMQDQYEKQLDEAPTLKRCQAIVRHTFHNYVNYVNRGEYC